MFFNESGTAYITSRETVSYKEMYERANTIASYIPERSLVFFIATNTSESLEAYVGFLNKHVIPLMIPSTLDTKLMVKLLDDYQPEFIWCPRSYALLENTDLLFSYGSYSLYITRYNNRIIPDAELALLLSTSGSTGSPKYIRLSYRNIKSNALSIADYQSLSSKDRAITTLPLSYSYGLSIINSHLLVGASIVLTDSTLFDKEFWCLLQNNRVTNFGGVPYTYTMLKRLRFEQMALPSLRFISQAGGRLGFELHKEFAGICANKGIDFFVMYGQTEATARISYLPASVSSEHIDKIGIPIPGGRFELIDVDGSLITRPDISGELIYYGDNVALGYALDRKDLEKGNEWNGRLETGDIATFDEKGFFRIVGRKKRFLKIYGNRVNLDEIENLLLSHNVVAACTGQDDAIQVFVESSKNPEAQNRHSLNSPKEIQHFLAELTGLHTAAIFVSFLETLPRTDSGKLSYVELEALC